MVQVRLALALIAVVLPGAALALWADKRQARLRSIRSQTDLVAHNPCLFQTPTVCRSPALGLAAHEILLTSWLSGNDARGLSLECGECLLLDEQT